MVLMGDSKDDYRSQDKTGRLMIFGNADNNDYLDNEDVKTLEKIIAGEMAPTTLSDANQDGQVNQKDIDFVKRMIAKERMNVYYQYYYDEDLLVESIQYPVENICSAGTNVALMMKSLGVVNRILLVDGGTKDEVLFSDFKNIEKASTSVLNADIEKVSKTDIHTIVTEDSSSYIKNYDVFEKAEIDVIRLSSSSAERSIGSILTIGYLMQVEDRANEYVRFCDGIIKDVESKISTLKESDNAHPAPLTF